ncbi:MAG: hypothetical protein LKI53_09115 [Bacteroidales bacterium]|jgi:hypothetical protein|nr:hypothetical protein [Bacteroidales bacterium]
MFNEFRNSICDFLNSVDLSFEETSDVFILRDRRFLIFPVPLSGFITCDSSKVFRNLAADAENELYEGYDIFYLYEDRWRSAGDLCKSRILTASVRFRSVFARKCSIISGGGSSEKIKRFINAYHSYGYVKSRYLFALRTGEGTVAAASFSSPRPIIRDMEDSSRVRFLSYEWTRFAVLPGVRVAGGMGKLLNAFICSLRAEHGAIPMEIMTYSDNEWSCGRSYGKLGFKYVSDRAPVKYYVNAGTFERIPQRRFQSSLFAENPEGKYYAITNMGSRKYILPVL